MMIDKSELRVFVKEYYAGKDSMHSLAHVDRLFEKALELSSGKDACLEVLLLGAYFHGIHLDHLNLLPEFAKKCGLSINVMEQASLAVNESFPDSEPVSIEGILLHDAHLIEGCKEHMVAKSLITGAERGQSIEETIAYMKENIFDNRSCILPEAQAIYQEMENFSKEFIYNLEASICKS